jgi:predicted MFS family arabinose efflux permease
MNSLTKKNLIFGILITSFYTPIIFFLMGLPMILQLKGFSPSVIGNFQILGLPMVIKFLFSPPVDKIVFKKNHYKKWTFYTGIFYVLSLLCISFLSFEENIYITFFVILFATCIATFIDIPLNALAIKVYTIDEHISAGSYKMSAYFASGLLGGGVFLLIFNHLGWQKTFLIIAFIVFISLFSLFCIQEKEERRKGVEKISLKTILSFFRQKNIGIWIFILCFYFAFISAVWVFMKPYLLSKGVSADNVAFYVGVYGSIVGFFGGILASSFAKKFSKKTVLILFSFLNIFSIFLLFYSESTFKSLHFSFIISAITLTSLSIAFSSSIVFALIMDYSRAYCKGVDYALQSSIFSLTRIISAVIAGGIISHLGYASMFLFEILCIALVIIAIYKFYKT